MSELAKCGLCGEPMPAGEQMFKYHGYSGECPKPPLPTPGKPSYEQLSADLADLKHDMERLYEADTEHLADLAEAVAALRFAKINGDLRYSMRTSTNVRYCDGVDNIDKILAKHK